MTKNDLTFVMRNKVTANTVSAEVQRKREMNAASFQARARAAKAQGSCHKEPTQ